MHHKEKKWHFSDFAGAFLEKKKAAKCFHGLWSWWWAVTGHILLPAGALGCWRLLQWEVQVRPACLNVRMKRQFVPAEAKIYYNKAKVNLCCSG